MPSEPGKSYYRFNGWNTAADGSGAVVDGSYAVTSSLRIYAQWAVLDGLTPQTGDSMVLYLHLFALLAFLSMIGIGIVLHQQRSMRC
jgi:hypothetical protein